MFQLSLLDHLRLTFGHVVYRQQAHARIARARTLQSRWLRAAETLLMAATTVAAIGAAFGRGYGYAIASAVFAVLSLVTLLLHLMFDLDASARVHASCAARLWQIREQYRALLSDLCDGVIDVDTARRGRDALMTELHAVYESAPLADQQIAGRLTDQAALSDEEIDVFLPRSLQKSAQPAAPHAVTGAAG
jgi:ABC-type transport system involved in cytochrome bd biosynthesis fused ATPase/permease subunit